MPISFNCPNCQKKLSVQDNMAGKVAKCPCGTQLKIPAPQQQPAPQQSAPQQPAAQPGQAPLQPMQQTNQPQSQSAFGDIPIGADLNAGTQQNMPVAGAPMGTSDLMAGGDISAMPMAGAQAAPAPTAQPAPAMAPPENMQNLNPDFQIQCVQCGQQYAMRPDLFGQTVACKCGAPIRFDDPLGSGGSMVDTDPLGLGEAMATDQPLAYQSQSQPNESKRQARSREDEVLKMYIKDEEEVAGGSSSGYPPLRDYNEKRTSFVMRLVALIIDGLIQGAVQQAVFWPVFFMAGTAFEVTGVTGVNGFIARMVLSMVVASGITFAWMMLESMMATTPGKMALGLRIVDGAGDKPALEQMLKRSVFKYGGNFLSSIAFLFVLAELYIAVQLISTVGLVISVTFFVGSLMALGATKLAWHDTISETQVVVK